MSYIIIIIIIIITILMVFNSITVKIFCNKLK